MKLLCAQVLKDLLGEGIDVRVYHCATQSLVVYMNLTFTYTDQLSSLFE